MQKNEPAKSKANILIVDDTPDNLRLLNQILSQEYKVRLAPNGIIGLKAAFTAPPDVILLDIMMPDMNGYEVAEKLKAEERTKDIPILFISALDDTESKVRGFRAGAVDYVTKPFQEMEVLARVKTHLSLRALYLQAQNEIKERIEKENQLHAVLSAIPDIIYRVRRDGTILDFKTSSTGLLFAPPDSLIGASITTIQEERIGKKFLASIQESLRSGAIQSLEFEENVGGALHALEARMKDCGPDEVIVVVRDVSERVRLEQMKSDFINRATHELRTPLTTMLLMIHLIDEGSTPEEQKEFWEILKTEINRERTLVENFLQVGRLENKQHELKIAPLLLVGLLKNVIKQFMPAAREKQISVDLINLADPGVPDMLIEADESALTQVFVNLLSNAIKFSPLNSKVIIQVEKKDPGVEISIADMGIGIPDAEIPMLFSRFFRAQNAVEKEIPGSGIGLFIVRSIVDLHKGKIKVYSELGKGSQFVVWLP